MNILVWNHDGIQVLMTGAESVPDPSFVGVVTDDVRAGNWSWTATPRPDGYYISFCRTGGHSIVGSWRAATWNLGLEVAVAFKQIVGRAQR